LLWSYALKSLKEKLSLTHLKLISDISHFVRAATVTPSKAYTGVHIIGGVNLVVVAVVVVLVVAVVAAAAGGYIVATPSSSDSSSSSSSCSSGTCIVVVA
jgi:hypothetical protein